MMTACLSGDFDRVKELVHNGVDLNLMHPRKHDSIFTEFMAWLYVRQDSDEIDYKPYRINMVEHLITLGADVTILGGGETNPLYYAMMAFDAEVAKILLEHGANPNGPIEG